MLNETAFWMEEAKCTLRSADRGVKYWGGKTTQTDEIVSPGIRWIWATNVRFVTKMHSGSALVTGQLLPEWRSLDS